MHPPAHKPTRSPIQPVAWRWGEGGETVGLFLSAFLLFSFHCTAKGTVLYETCLLVVCDNHIQTPIFHHPNLHKQFCYLKHSPIYLLSFTGHFCSYFWIGGSWTSEPPPRLCHCTQQSKAPILPLTHQPILSPAYLRLTPPSSLAAHRCKNLSAFNFMLGLSSSKRTPQLDILQHF